MSRSKAAILPLQFCVTLYIIFMFVASHNEGYTWLTHAALVAMVLSLGFFAAVKGLVLPREPALAIIALFWIYAAVSVAWANDTQLAVVSSISLALSLLGPVAILVALWNGMTLRPIAIGVVIGFSISAVSAYWEYEIHGARRVAGLASNPNRLGGQAVVAGIIVLAVAKERRAAAWVFALGAALAATLLGASVKMVLGLTALLVFGSAMLMRRVKRNRTLTAFLLILLPVLLSGLVATGLSDSSGDSLFGVRTAQSERPIMDSQHMEGRAAVLRARLGSWSARVERQLVRLSSDERRSDGRFVLLQEGLEFWTASPLVGHGQSQYRRLSSRGQIAHNNYIDLLVNLGVVGFLLYYSIVAIIFVRALKARHLEWPDARVLVTAVLLLVAWEVGQLTYTQRLFWLYLAVLIYLSNRVTHHFGQHSAVHGTRPQPYSAQIAP